MARLPLKKTTLKALFGKSGNQCAFPECKEQLIDEENNCIGQLCHIESANETGARFNPDSNDEYRRSYENLILLCPTHHYKIDKSKKFSTEKLKSIKTDHEKIFQHSNFKVNDRELIKFMKEMDNYFIEVAKNNRDWQSKCLLARNIDAQRNHFQIIDNICRRFNDIKEICQFLNESDKNLWNEIKFFLNKKANFKKPLKRLENFNNPFIKRNWEIHNLQINNILGSLEIDLIHIEIKFLEEFLKYKLTHWKAKCMLRDRKRIFKNLAQTAIYAD
ncbi:MAG: hypothetical protein OXC37_03845 [Bdellovibrionaceae bacterium]|nr:hypothetical protein [Pseudobdellovibrionaceae bacterium]